MYPLLLKPVLKDYIWGGTKLQKIYDNSDFSRIAEAWTLAVHEDGSSLIANGEYAGQTLDAPIKKLGAANILGVSRKSGEAFPILIKLIDAAANLSIQVHPDDDYARRSGKPYGKTEMWYVVDCDAGAYILCGFKEKLTADEFAGLIKNDGLPGAMNKITVSPGDVVFIEAGMVHAICGGIFIAEIQQNSNTTYRIYDYGRTDAAGNPRELHVEEAKVVSNLSPAGNLDTRGETEILPNCKKTLLNKCDYFSVYELKISGVAKLDTEGVSFHHLSVIEGSAKIANKDGKVSAGVGGSVFISADSGEYAVEGNATVLLAFC